MLKNRKDLNRDNSTIGLFNIKLKEPSVNSVLEYTNQNNSKYDENNIYRDKKRKVKYLGNIKQNKSKSNKFTTTPLPYPKIKQSTSKEKIKITNKSKSPRINRGKKKGKVFQDTREDVIHYKLIDNMMFKAVDSNNSASIIFSDESEITQADVDQAIAGRDGSCIAIPVKRKKDIYKEFLRWAHVQEKNERRAKIEKEVIKKYKNKRKYLHIDNTTINKHQTNVTTTISSAPRNNSEYSRDYRNTNKPDRLSRGEKQASSMKTNKNSTEFSRKSGNLGQNIHSSDFKNKKHKDKLGTKSFKAESVEIQYDPDFLNKLHNSVKEQKIKNMKRKKKTKKQKQRQTYEGNPADISADDYSAQEMFMINTQKEAMGRRYYQMFVNKTASDFWDNNTLETTKILEFLIPLGEHLHKTLEEPPPNEGKHFVNDLQMYKTELEKFTALVKKDKAETRQDVVALLEEPYEHVCETKYSEDEIKIMFGWDSDEYDQFEKLLEETREIWFDLQLFHHCYQFVGESAESYYSDNYNYTKDEQLEIINNNTWLSS